MKIQEHGYFGKLYSTSYTSTSYTSTSSVWGFGRFSRLPDDVIQAGILSVNIRFISVIRVPSDSYRIDSYRIGCYRISEFRQLLKEQALNKKEAVLLLPFYIYYIQLLGD